MAQQRLHRLDERVREDVVALRGRVIHRVDVPGKQAAPVSDYELADRLSYFLWSSMPDAELRDAAASGKLHSPAVLQAQMHRMLRDQRVSRMGTEFGGAWLHLSGFEALDEKKNICI